MIIIYVYRYFIREAYQLIKFPDNKPANSLKINPCSLSADPNFPKAQKTWLSISQQLPENLATARLIFIIILFLNCLYRVDSYLRWHKEIRSLQNLQRWSFSAQLHGTVLCLDHYIYLFDTMLLQYIAETQKYLGS